MPSLGLPELVIILVVALIIFGPGKLPDIGRAVGKGIREFKQAASGLEDTAKETQGEKKG
ncbi:MAG: twin-arginine translocase TatA/TatE family subunit [Chloroflexota bacterium]